MAIQGKSGQLVRFTDFVDEARQGKPLISFLKGFAGGYGVKWPTMYYHYQRAEAYIFIGDGGFMIFLNQGTEHQAAPENQDIEGRGKLFADPDA